MSTRPLHHASAIAALVLSVLAANAFAGAAYHPTSNEAGAVFHPDHASSRSRAEIESELTKAQAHPAWNSASRGAPWPVAKLGEPKTRAQVVAELDAAMKHPAWNSVSRGAPWPSVLASSK